MITKDNDYICKSKYRVAIFLYYDATGIVDDYIVYYLSQLKGLVSRLIVVCNGYISEEGRSTLSSIADTVYERENKGFDGWAYKDVLENVIGWDNVVNYDELIITNNTIYGPITPFEEMFEAMEGSHADFWGALIRYQDKSARTFNGRPTVHGYIPDFLLSNFWVIRKKAIVSKAFKDFWDTLHPLNSYEDSGIYCEPVFAQSLRDAGLIMDSYMGDERRFSCQSPTETDTYYQLSREQIPIIRRKAFFNPLFMNLNCDHGDNTVRTMEYITEHTDYDESMIYKNLCRTVNLYDIHNRLHLDYILPEKYESEDLKTLKTAVILRLGRAEKLSYCKKYLSDLPENTDIFVTVKTEEIKNMVKAELDYVKEIFVSSDTGFVNSLFVLCKDVIEKGGYDYICTFDDVELKNVRWERTEEACRERCLGTLIGSKDNVYSILSLMEKNKHIGAMATVPPYCANMLSRAGGDWDCDFKSVKALYDALGLKVNLDSNKPCVYAQYGAMWIRPQALRLMTGFDFTQIKNTIPDIDNAAMHIVLYAIQQAGFISARAISAFEARLDITNMNYMLGDICRNIKNKAGDFRNYSQLMMILNDALDAYNGIEPVIMKSAEDDDVGNQQSFDSDTLNSILDKASAGLLAKKLAKKFVPKKLWSKMRKRHYKKKR
ncbi:MAG: hypothetical protein IJF09_09770 [Ruminiclostridium sp.]|nr:hypothetical protein [Ruminiclostridium sp.]